MIIIGMTIAVPSYTTAQVMDSDSREELTAHDGGGVVSSSLPRFPLLRASVGSRTERSLSHQALVQEAASRPKNIARQASDAPAKKDSSRKKTSKSKSIKAKSGKAKSGKTEKPTKAKESQVASEVADEADEPDGTSGSEPAWPSFSAKHEIRDYYAHDDGSINEWAPGYYAAHDWSEAGQAIHASDIGDIIIIDGTPVTITDRRYFSEYDPYEDIRACFDPSCVIFQTCAGNDTILILAGHADGWGPFEVIGGGQETYTNEEVTYETWDEPEAVEEDAIPFHEPVAFGAVAANPVDESVTSIEDQIGSSAISGYIGQ